MSMYLPADINFQGRTVPMFGFFFYFELQGGITCGAIDEPRKSSKAVDERVIINKNVAIARFRDKNVFLFF